ncbi:MAG: type II secretion system protein [Pirellulaceae bacterium]|nr:type II secretion system protein [Pirellulaceae bacterium]
MMDRSPIHNRRKSRGSRCPSRRRRGFSLLEITIGSIIAAGLVVMASGVAMDVSRHMAANIVETQVACEARLAIESLRRDFGGTLPDDLSGDRAEWRLVGRMIPNTNELRLCFDSDQDASADWVLPDRVIIYSLDGDRLIRSDLTSGNTYTVARHVDDVDFVANAGDITISIDFEMAGFAETYTFVTSDVL